MSSTAYSYVKSLSSPDIACVNNRGIFEAKYQVLLMCGLYATQLELDYAGIEGISGAQSRKVDNFIKTIYNTKGGVKMNLSHVLKWMRKKLVFGIYALGGVKSGGPSTARNAKSYHECLFPELTTVKEMLCGLKGKTVIDIGSGLTHRNPRSLISIIAREGWPINFVGVEPRVCSAKGGFGRRNYFIVELPSAIFRLFRKEKLLSVKLVSASAHKLPFSSSSIDCIISHNAIPVWASDLDIFKEFVRVLRTGGEIRLYPVIKTRHQDFFTQDTQIGNFLHKNFQLKFVPYHISPRLIRMLYKLIYADFANDITTAVLIKK